MPADSQPADREQNDLEGIAPARLPTNVRLLGLASLLNDVAGEMVYPLLPMFVTQSLGASKTLLGVMEGSAETTASIVKLFSGGLSDRLAIRKAFIVTGYALGALSRPIIAAVSWPWQVIVLRSSDRFGKGIRAAPRDALVADSTLPSMRGRAYGFNRAMDHLGAAIGPLLTFAFLWLWPGRYRTLFLLTVVPGLAVVALVLFGLRERPIVTPAAKEFGLPTAKRPFGRSFWMYLLAMVVFTLGNSSDMFLLVRVGEMGVSTETLPLLWAAFHIVKSSVSLIAGGAVDRFGPRPLIFAGWAIYALIYLAFSQADGAAAGWTFFLIYGLFHALTEPAERTLVANLVPADRKGLAFGWFNAAIGIAALPSSWIFGAIYENYGATVAFSWSAVLALLAGLLLATVGRVRKLEGA